MKKVLFLMLFLIVFGAANMTSQVRIGGNGVPNGAAVLDLNATDGTNNGTKGLALPRVSLANNATQITSGTANLNGMLVYNTNATLGAGIYYWNGSKWAKISDEAFTEVDGVIGNEVTNATTNGGLVRAGSGTAASPYTLGIASKGVDTSMLKTYPQSGFYFNTASGVRLVNYTVIGHMGARPVGADTTYAFDNTGCLTTPQYTLNTAGASDLFITSLNTTNNGVRVHRVGAGNTFDIYMYCWK